MVGIYRIGFAPKQYFESHTDWIFMELYALPTEWSLATDFGDRLDLSSNATHPRAKMQGVVSLPGSEKPCRWRHLEIAVANALSVFRDFIIHNQWCSAFGLCYFNDITRMHAT